MCDDHAVNRTFGRNRNSIDNAISGIPEKFETGNQRNIEIAALQLGAQDRRMIKNNFARPTADQRPSIEIANATNTERLRLLHSLGASELGFGRGFRSLHTSVRRDVPVMAVTLHRLPASLTNCMFEGSGSLLLRRGRPRHVEDFLLDDGAVEIVDAVIERNLREAEGPCSPNKR